MRHEGVIKVRQFNYITESYPRSGAPTRGSRVGKHPPPPWKKSWWALPTLEILAVD